MNKETFLQRYIDIETKIFIKSDKNKKIEDLFNGGGIDVNANFSLADILYMLSELIAKEIIIRQPLYGKLIYPILSDHVEQNNVEAIKALLRLDQHLISYQGYSKDTKYSSWALLEKGLSISPNDKELLELSERKTRDYLDYTLHELPIGVLYGDNGATIEECEELIKEVEKYDMLCSKLDRNESELIMQCRYYYSTYKAYLSVFKSYKNFEDYLGKEGGSPK